MPESTCDKSNGIAKPALNGRAYPLTDQSTTSSSSAPAAPA